MLNTRLKTAIALQGGGALGAYAVGALSYLYENQPGFRPSCISGVSIGAFNAAIVASHPDDPIPHLKGFWDDITILDMPWPFDWLEPRLAYVGNWNFFRPRFDYFALPVWNSFYDVSPIAETLSDYIDLDRLNGGDVKFVVTATDIESGEITEFTNQNPDEPITLDHIVASGSLPPGFPPKPIGDKTYWDGGLFNNSPLSSLFNLIDHADAASTRILVINLFAHHGPIPRNLMDVHLRQEEIHFSNKTSSDIALARKINKLVAVIEGLASGSADGENPLVSRPDLADVAKYKVFENIIEITNARLARSRSGIDFSTDSIQARMRDGYADTEHALKAKPESAQELKQDVARSDTSSALTLQDHSAISMKP